MSEATKKRWQDKAWKYTPAEETDLHATFRRIRKQMKEQEKKPAPNVRSLKKKEPK